MSIGLDTVNISTVKGLLHPQPSRTDLVLSKPRTIHNKAKLLNKHVPVT
jgi:hypothetical protein